MRKLKGLTKVTPAELEGSRSLYKHVYEKWTFVYICPDNFMCPQMYENRTVMGLPAERSKLLNNPRFAVSYSFHYSSELFQVTSPNSLINYYMRLTLILRSPRNKLVYTSSYY